MNLKSLIRILISSGRNKILWKTNQELISKIREIHFDFRGSLDGMNEPEIICDSILQMSDRISIYQRGQINEVEILNRIITNTQAVIKKVKHIENLKKIIEKRNLEESKKEGSFVIELNEDELYRLFSLEYRREKQLNKLV